MDANRILASYRKKWNKIALCRMENDLVSEQLLRKEYDFSRNIFEKHAKSRKECCVNFLPYKDSCSEKVSYESEDSTKLKVQNKTTHRNDKDLKAKSLKSTIFNYNESLTDAQRRKQISTFLNQNEKFSTNIVQSLKTQESMINYSDAFKLKPDHSECFDDRINFNTSNN